LERFVVCGHEKHGVLDALVTSMRVLAVIPLMTGFGREHERIGMFGASDFPGHLRAWQHLSLRPSDLPATASI